MLVQVPNKSTFFGPMQQDPLIIREKLFQGIDRDYNVTNMGIVVEVIGELENFHMSREELEATRLGKHINELRRNTSDRILASRAKSLVKKWRDLLTPIVAHSEPGGGNNGPPPGGGNNNNSSLATNGNTGSRLNNTHVALTSPRLSGQPHRGPALSPAVRVPQSVNNSSHPTRTPRTVSSHVSPRVNNSQLSPRVPPPQGVKTLPPVRSVPASPAKSAIGTGTRTSPVVISSGSTSPSHSLSRPNSPPSSSTFPPVNSREASPLRSTNASPSATSNKRLRGRDEYDQADAKRPRVELHNGTSQQFAPTSPNSDNLNNRPTKVTRRSRPVPTNSHSNLTKQMLQVHKVGKVRTTQEVVKNLGIESRASLSPPVNSVTDLVPNENKSELMDRFFSSQKVSSLGERSEPPSRPSTADEVSSSDLTSAGPSRAQSPGRPGDSVDDILALLPPIDAAAVLAELQAAEAEEEPEVEGLLPVFKPLQEVTTQLIDELNNGQLEHIGGITDHSGVFKEWHEMTALESKDGELLHILPYSVID